MSEQKLLTVYLNEPELRSIEFLRMALSEGSIELRLRAITNAKHDVSSTRIEFLSLEAGTEWISSPDHADFVQWVAKSSIKRHEAVHEFNQTTQRYESKNERKLNVAEHIGKSIWHSIIENKFKGLHTEDGILRQVSNDARMENVSGAKDKDTLRKLWKSYRGVVHLGMAIDYCEDNPDQGLVVLHLAELFRRGLSENCPNGTSKPYVDPEEQISFVYLSRLLGPRFGDRGLPFDVD